jgi:hypothetical protein
LDANPAQGISDVVSHGEDVWSFTFAQLVSHGEHVLPQQTHTKIGPAISSKDRGEPAIRQHMPAMLVEIAKERGFCLGQSNR